MKVLVTKSCQTHYDHVNCSLSGSSVHGISLGTNSSGKDTGVGCHTLLQMIFPTQDPTVLQGSPALQADSLLSDPTRSPLSVYKLAGFFFFFFGVCLWEVFKLKSEKIIHNNVILLIVPS